MEYELNEQQEEFVAEAERLVRREKWMDVANSPKLFFQRLKRGYYDEQLKYYLRWLTAQGGEYFEDEE